MTGGTISDTLDKANLRDHLGGDSHAQRVVMIKCRDCGFLNEEDSKFCQECGSAIKRFDQRTTRFQRFSITGSRMLAIAKLLAWLGQARQTTTVRVCRLGKAVWF